jgi:hypothetical protein
LKRKKSKEGTENRDKKYLENTIKLGSKHNVALGLQLSSHECFLAVELKYVTRDISISRKSNVDNVPSH